MISALFIFLASLCNAVMDILENENFHGSVFGKLNPHFWYKRDSWRWARMVFQYRLDAWHLFKSAMVVSMILAVVLYRPIVNWWFDVLFYGFIWNTTFGISYKIFEND